MITPESPSTPKVLEEPATESATDSRPALARPWNVLVLNDPITLMSYVTMVLMRLFGYPKPQAEKLMLEVHEKGRSIVWTGGREQAEIYVQKLHAYHLLAKLEPVE